MATENNRHTRRQLFQTGAAVAGVALAPQGALRAQSGRKFRAWVSRGTGPGRTTLQELTLRPISGRQVVVRTEATNL